jgi:hypothetical protein
VLSAANSATRLAHNGRARKGNRFRNYFCGLGHREPQDGISHQSNPQRPRLGKMAIICLNNMDDAQALIRGTETSIISAQFPGFCTWSVNRGSEKGLPRKRITSVPESRSLLPHRIGRNEWTLATGRAGRRRLTGIPSASAAFESHSLTILGLSNQHLDWLNSEQADAVVVFRCSLA